MDLHTVEKVEYSNCALASAAYAAIFVHGRGDNTDKMELLAKEVASYPNIAHVFPKASDHTWYPKSFLAPREENEPFFSSALALYGAVLTKILETGIPSNKIFLFGFSQGACLTLDFAARNAQKFAGIFALSGGLIGPEVDMSNYRNSFDGTSIFIGCSDTDNHVPEVRLHESKDALQQLGAEVELRVYPGMGHLINEDEMEYVKNYIKNTINP